MGKSLRFVAVLMLIIFNLEKVTSQVYVESTFDNISFQVSPVVNVFKPDILFESSMIMPGVDFRLSLGIFENLGIFGGFCFSEGSSTKGNQILPFTYAESMQNSQWYSGIEYFLGSPQSKLRHKFFGQLSYSNDQLSTQYIVTDAIRRIRMAGIAYGGGVASYYFVQPYLSLNLNASYQIGRYTYSELEGRSYTENIGFNNIRLGIGLAYHFGGR